MKRARLRAAALKATARAHQTRARVRLARKPGEGIREMADNQDKSSGEQGTMQGVLRDKPKDADSFADNQYAGDTEPSQTGTSSDAGGANVSQQGGGSGSSKQGGNTGSTPNASG